LELPRATLTLIAVAVYLAICVGIGAWSLRRTRTSFDFFMSGRDLGVVLATLAAFASNMSGFAFVGGPGLIYSMGTSSVWILSSAGVGGVVSYALVAKRIRLFAELGDCVSLPDVVALRYGSEAVRGWVAVAIVLGVLGYLATQIMAMGVVLQGILADAGLAGSLTLEGCVAAAALVLVFYSAAGGIRASVVTSAFQGTIMLVASLLVFLAVLRSSDGGLVHMASVIAADDPTAMSPFGSLGMLGCLSWFFVFGVGLAGQPHIVTKHMMIRNLPDIRRILPLGIAAVMIGGLLWVGVGMATRSLVLEGVIPALAAPDQAASAFLRSVASPLLAALVYAALIAAIMSSADAFLNIGTAALVHDLPRALTGRDLDRELVWARGVTVALATLATAFALYTGDLVALLGAFGWGTFAAALVPVLGIGLNWTRATPAAAVAAVAVSLAVNFGVKLSGFGIPHGIDVGALALVASLLVFIGLSLLSEPPDLDDDVRLAMEL